MSYAPFPLVWGFFGSGGGGGGPSFGVIQTDFGTYPTASGSSDVLTLISADSTRYYFTGTALTDTVTLTVTGLIPPGGSYGQILAKASGSNFDVEWRDGVQITSVYNATGSTITKGSVVYISGASGNLPTIALAKADVEATSSKTYGLVVADISSMSSGSVVHSGQIKNLDTFGVTEGVTLYLSPTTAGAYTTTKPSAPDHMVAIGVCTRAHPTQGTIEVSIQNGFELQELHNVAISSPSNGQVLSYESSTSLWKNTTLSGTGTVTSVSVTSANGFAGTVANSTTTPAITLSTTITGLLKGNGTAISAATAGTDYQAPITQGNLTESTSSVLTITGGSNAIIGSGTTIEVKQATSLQGGYLSGSDWSAFNGKASVSSSNPQPVGSGPLPGTSADAARIDHVHAGVSSLAKNGSTQLTGNVTLSAGSGVTLTQSGSDISIAATGGGGSGTVTDVSVVSSNGFAGTVANSTTTPAITLSTTVTGVLKGNGTAISAATAGTDYQAPITGGASTITTTDLTQNRVLLSDASGKVSASTVSNVTLGYLDASSSIQTQLNSKQATITGAASTITTANLTASKALVSDGSGKVVASSVASSTLDFLDATSSVQTQLNSKTSLGSSAPANVSSAGSVGIATDAARSDHAHRGISSFSKNGSSQLFGDVTISAGTGVTLTQSGQDISIASTGGGSGTVTSVSVTSANGLAGTVTNPTTTPAISLSTTVTGLLKGDGTAISAASSGTDYEPPITKGNLTEATSSVLTISGGTGSVIGSGTSIEVKQASSTQDGYLSSANWTTFNNKEPAVTKGNLTEATSSVLTITGGTSAVIGSGTSIQVKQADTTQAGYISTNDYRDFFDKLPLNYIDYSARVRMGSTTFIGSSSQSVSVSGSQAANSYSSSSVIGKLPHITHVSISTAGANCGYRMGNNVTYNLQNIGGGFYFSHIFMINDASSVANARNFVGMNTSNAAVAINTTTSTDPFRATFTNFFAMGYDGFIDANFKIFHNAGSAGSTTTIDLGSGFSITPAADIFQVTFINIKNTNDLYYDVIGLISGNRAFGKITSNLPTSSALYQHTTRSNGGSTAVVTYETGGMLLYQTN